MPSNLAKEIRQLAIFAKEAARRLRYYEESSKKVKAAADIISNLLIEKGLIEPYKKSAAAKNLQQHDKALEILHDILNDHVKKSSLQKTASINGSEFGGGNVNVSPTQVNYRGYVPVDRTLAGQLLKKRILGE